VTDQKNEKQRALVNIEYRVVKPFIDAAALGSGCAAFAVPLDGPIINWAVVGAGFSFFWYWGKNNLTRPEKKAGSHSPSRQIVVNSATESRKVRIFDQVAPQFITRESYVEGLTRWLGLGRKSATQRDAAKEPEPKPEWLEETIFTSYHDNQAIQLSERDVARFLSWAWRYRARGKGLSERSWVRNWKQRPQWYHGLGPVWYYAMMNLLWNLEAKAGRDVITWIGHQQYGLARDPHQTLQGLKWAEAAQKGKR